MERALRVVCGAWVCACVLALPREGGELPELRLFAPAAYELETTLFLNDAARADKEVGYKIRAGLLLQPLWSRDHVEHLLQFRLQSPKLHLRGKHVNAEFMPYESIWDMYGDTTFYAHWKNGVIETAYLDLSEPLDILNYKKSIVSLFQFQVLDGEYNETDVSGPCSVLYETVSQNVFRKIKRGCPAEGAEGAEGVVVEARRAARYTLSGALDALDALYADELLVLGHAALGLKARAWQRLQRRAEAPARGPARASLLAALDALPPALRPASLEMEPAATPIESQDLSASLEENRDLLESVERASDDADTSRDERLAVLALRLLPAVRAASEDLLHDALQRQDLLPALPALCRLLGLAGTRAAHAAADRALQLHAPDPPADLAHHYLSALALAPTPDERVVRDALRLGEEGRAPDVADGALLAAGALAGRLAPGHPAALAVRASLLRSLPRCAAERCRAVRLRALGHLRRADAVDALLAHAREAAVAGEARAALAALDALADAPEGAVTFSRLDSLTELVLDSRCAPEVRAAALDVLVARRAPVPLPLAALAAQLNERGEHELRRVLWGRLAELAPRHERVRQLLDSLHARLRGWDGQAHGGSSSVLRRSLGWAAPGGSALLDSVQAARGGLLRRGTVRLLVRTDDERELDALSVEVWTRGLEAFGGASEVADERPAEEAAGGLALGVGGARGRDVALFAGQAELLAHVWAGTASAPTPALRALLPLAERAGGAALAAGARVAVSWRALLAPALDARATVSLWHRRASAALWLRVGAAAEARASLAPLWGRLEARALSSAAPRLALSADLDFYDATALCVRVRSDDHVYRRNVTLESRQGARRLRVRRSAVTSRAAAGRTLALGAPNDAACRDMAADEL